MHSKLCCCLHPHLFSDSFNPQFLGENPSKKKKGDIPPDLAQGTSISGATKFASNSSQVICAGDYELGSQRITIKSSVFQLFAHQKSWIFRHGSNFGGPSFFPVPVSTPTSPSPLISVILPRQADAKASQLRLGDGNEHMMSINVVKSDWRACSPAGVGVDQQSLI